MAMNAARVAAAAVTNLKTPTNPFTGSPQEASTQAAMEDILGAMITEIETYYTGGGGVTDHTALTSLSWTLSGHTGTANRIAGFNGAGAAALFQIGVDIQAYSAQLATFAGLTPTAGNLIVGSGSAWQSLTAGPARAAVEKVAPIIGLMEGGALEDDFPWTPSSTTRPGTLNWAQTTIGSAPTYSSPIGTETEIGLRRISTALSTNTGGHMRSNETVIVGLPAIGTRWTVKCAQISSGAAQGWSGFITAISTSPTTAASVQFLGVRWEANGTISGVTKTGSSVETVTSLGVAMTAGTFRCVGFDIVDVGGGSKGVQWWVGDLSNRDTGPVVTFIGSPVTSTLPTSATFYASALGLITTDGTNQQADIDFWGQRGRHKRG
jgi:hypothetical protein